MLYLFGGPLEAGNNTVLDLIQILDTFCDVNYDVGPGTLGSKAPNLTSFGGIVVVLLCKVPRTLLHLLTWSYITLNEKYRN